MNKFIRDQLNKCQIARVPEFNDDTTELIITRRDTSADVLKLHGCYLIEISDDFYNSDKIKSDNIFSTPALASKHLKCVITQFRDNLVKMDASGYDNDAGIDKNDVYLGIWIPRSAFQIIKSIT